MDRGGGNPLVWRQDVSDSVDRRLGPVYPFWKMGEIASRASVNPEPRALRIDEAPANRGLYPESLVSDSWTGRGHVPGK